MSPLRPALLALALALPAHAEDRAAPDYSARRLGSAEQVSLTMLRGRVVLLNTWATWCSPCRKEMPAFEALYRAYRDQGGRDRGLEMVGVNIDEGQADEQVARYVEAKKIGFPIWRDPENRFAKRFRVLGVPETFLVSRDGVIVRHWQGPIDPHAPDNLKSIQAALVAPAAGRGLEVSAGGTAPDDSAQRGRRLAEQRGCLTCHSTDGAKGVGPSWKAGTEVELSDGRTVLRDHDYLAHAIVDPDAEIAAGYAKGVMAGAMPGRKLTEPEIESLVLHLLSLSDEAKP